MTPWVLAFVATAAYLIVGIVVVAVVSARYNEWPSTVMTYAICAVAFPLVLVYVIADKMGYRL